MAARRFRFLLFLVILLSSLCFSFMEYHFMEDQRSINPAPTYPRPEPLSKYRYGPHPKCDLLYDSTDNGPGPLYGEVQQPPFRIDEKPQGGQTRASDYGGKPLIEWVYGFKDVSFAVLKALLRGLFGVESKNDDEVDRKDSMISEIENGDEVDRKDFMVSEIEVMTTGHRELMESINTTLECLILGEDRAVCDRSYIGGRENDGYQSFNNAVAVDSLNRMVWKVDPTKFHDYGQAGNIDVSAPAERELLVHMAQTT